MVLPLKRVNKIYILGPIDSEMGEGERGQVRQRFRTSKMEVLP